MTPAVFNMATPQEGFKDQKEPGGLFRRPVPVHVFDYPKKDRMFRLCHFSKQSVVSSGVGPRLHLFLCLLTLSSLTRHKDSFHSAPELVHPHLTVRVPGAAGGLTARTVLL